MARKDSSEEPLELAHEVGEFRQETSELKDQVRLLRLALDEFHTDFMWAVQNLRPNSYGQPPFQVMSLPLDPEAEDFCEQANERSAGSAKPKSGRTETVSADTGQSDELPELTIARIHAVEEFRKYLDEAGHRYRAPVKEEVERLDKTMVLIPDFVIVRPAEALLITVRHTLSESERADMAKWKQAFGSQLQAAQVWGRQGKYGVSWRTEVIVERDKNPPGPDAPEASDLEANSDAESEATVGRLSPPENSIRRTNQRRTAPPSQPLYLRIMRLHMTDIVRTIGYEELPQKEAYDRLIPL